MALSDVLFETVERLETDSYTYLHSDFYKKFYSKEIRDAVTSVLDELDNIRQQLDAPPSSYKVPKPMGAKERIVIESTDELSNEELYRATKITSVDGRVLKDRNGKRGE